MSAPATPPEALVRTFDERFVNRHDTYALQHPGGRYTRARWPVDLEALRDHLQGRQTIALYTPDSAGRSRWLGRRPSVRGVAMNPIDHPHGGGEGRTSGGRHPVTPWGKPTKGKKTRHNKATDRLIVRRRHKR